MNLGGSIDTAPFAAFLADIQRHDGLRAAIDARMCVKSSPAI
jgi:hypothetical protein